MTKISPEDEAKGRFLGDAQVAPPRARGGQGTCSTCQSPVWRRVEQARKATRDQRVTVFADGTAVPDELDEWQVEGSAVGGWVCLNGHPLNDKRLAELLNVAIEFGEPIGV